MAELVGRTWTPVPEHRWCWHPIQEGRLPLMALCGFKLAPSTVRKQKPTDRMCRHCLTIMEKDRSRKS